MRKSRVLGKDVSITAYFIRILLAASFNTDLRGLPRGLGAVGREGGVGGGLLSDGIW